MGLQSVRQLALGFSLIDQYAGGKCAGFDYPGFWSHALLMGLTMKSLGELCRMGAPDELFTCGLLARIGNLALATAYPLEYALVLAQAVPDADLLALERQSLQTDHLHLSGVLLAQWGIPNSFLEAVQFHETPMAAKLKDESRPLQLLQALHLAWRLSNFLTTPLIEPAYQVSELTLLASQLGIDEAAFAHCVDSVAKAWRSWGQKLNVRHAVVPAFSEMMQTKVRPDQEANAAWLRVLIVEDDPIVRMLLQTWLTEQCHYTVRTAENGQQALATTLEFKPHVVLTDWMMPVMDGLELCKALRVSDWGQNIYVIMLTSAESEAHLVSAFDAGVDDYLTKPVNTRALSARLQAAWRYVRLRDAWERDHARLTRTAAELALSNRRLQFAALNDPLTELANRRAGNAALTQSWSASVRHGHLLSILSIDIDHFKRINDTYGHAAGDLVLQTLGKSLRSIAREEDTVCRWGGEEFLVICPLMAAAEGARMAERLRGQIAKLGVAWEAQTLQFTVSLGLASWHQDLQSHDQLLAQADKALYAAKTSGRNRLAIFTSAGICFPASS
jgi:diguanylate cyclase (GGDEF)-like protein